MNHIDRLKDKCHEIATLHTRLVGLLQCFQMNKAQNVDNLFNLTVCFALWRQDLIVLKVETSLPVLRSKLTILNDVVLSREVLSLEILLQHVFRPRRIS